MHRINVVFPMAGDGIRFGGDQFKPFIDGTEKLFIELAKEQFDVLKSRDFHLVFYFIFRRDQELKFAVSSRLLELFPKDDIILCILEQPTKGPLETVKIAISQYNISGLSFVCDCDHAVNISTLLPHISNGSISHDAIIPIWNITLEEHPLWAKVRLGVSGSIISYFEKEVVEYDAESVKGIIGCYLFRNIQTVVADGADFTCVLKNLDCIAEPVLDAGFFGTPDLLTSYRFKLARRKTFFIDIDGTLLFLPKHVTYDSADTHVLPGTYSKLLEWKSQGHQIVLTTGRVTDRREKLEKQLSDLKIPYDQLVTNLPSGPRILINDKKPYSEIYQMAQAIQLKRNEGVSQVIVRETPDIIRRLKGGSFANVYLIKDEGQLMVRKYIRKTDKLQYENLRRQHDDMTRFRYYCPSLFPKILGSIENESEFSYDIKYFEGYVGSHTLTSEIKKYVVKKVIAALNSEIYCYAKIVNGNDWMNMYLSEKIYPRISQIEAFSKTFNNIINSEFIYINGKQIRGLKSLLNNLKISLGEIRVSPIHGDLTLENIMYNPNTNDVRIIDPAGSRPIDCSVLDTSKLFQSLIAKYETWDNYESLVASSNTNEYVIPSEFLIETEDYSYVCPKPEFCNAIFFLGTHCIRMTPFLYNKSQDKCLLALLLATYYISCDLNS